MTDEKRGKQYEAEIDAGLYLNDGFHSLPQLCSFAHQLHEIHSLKPKSVLEIGIGNGFTSAVLKCAGIDVVTVDINPSLKPDICCSIEEIPEKLNGRRFDLVVCCEVLEHMPLESLKPNIQTLRAIGDRLFMTLPNFKRTIGFGGLARMPYFGHTAVRAYLEIPIKKNFSDGPHFWEVGSQKDCSQSSIVSILKQVYGTARTGKFALNPYHIFFHASSVGQE